MVAWLDSGVHINRLRVRSAGEPMATRMRAERALACTAQRPASLPPQAILCIRRLADPRPGLLSLEGSRDAPPEWSRALAERVNDAASRAARPFAGAVPADAGAVLFADRAELLACLAADACERRLDSRWWWRSLIGNPDRVWRLADAWRAEPRSIAAAFDLLATRMGAVPFVRGLEPADVRALLAAMLAAHGFAADPPDANTGVTSSLPSLSDTGGDAASRAEHLARMQASSSLLPWRSWAPEALLASGLRLDQRRLLGLALMIRRAPIALSPSLVAAVLEWEGTSRAAPTSALPADRTRFDPADERPLLAVGTPAAEREPVSRAPEPRASVIEERQGFETGVSASSQHEVSAGHRSPLRSSELPASASSETASVFAPSLATDVCLTGCGGVLFLVNLGIHLGLYGDFTTPRQPGIALSIWDFATIAGRRLAGADMARDPLWDLLATLAKRGTHDEPGAGFEPPIEWRVSADWLRPFALVNGVWRWHTSSDRLRVRHPAGFVAVDVLRSAGETAAEQARREVGMLAHESRPRLRRWHRRAQVTSDERPIARWSAWLIAFAGARLAAAMPGQTARSAGRLLCRVPASVVVTPAHLHAVFPLDVLPIEVRLSGLDRDPGWIPAAGRTVTFAFE